MPRPTPAQLVYGSVTVICSTLAMLLLSREPSGPGVAVIAVAGLLLGLLVALTVPAIHTVRRAGARSAAGPDTATGAGAAKAAARTTQTTAVSWSAGNRRADAGGASRIHARHDAATPHATERPAQSARRVVEPSLRL